MGSDLSFTDFGEPFDPVEAKKLLIMHRAKFSWKPCYAFVQDNFATELLGKVDALLKNWESF